MKIETSEQFKEARHRLRFSIAQAAEVCGVDMRTIRRWEAGGRDPHPSACKLMEIELAKLPEVDDQGVPY